MGHLIAYAICNCCDRIDRIGFLYSAFILPQEWILLFFCLFVFQATRIKYKLTEQRSSINALTVLSCIIAFVLNIQTLVSLIIVLGVL